MPMRTAMWVSKLAFNSQVIGIHHLNVDILGEYKNNKRHGKGKFIYTNGNIYDGSWENDMQSGEGKMVYSTGNTYIGMYKNGVREGQGKFIYQNGGKISTMLL
jgi:hypothetical protein